MSNRPRNPQLRLLPLPADYEPPFDLEASVDELQTAEQMVAWVRELVRDYWEGDEEWSNDTLDLFLEGLASAVSDLPDDHEKPDWSLVARALLAATVRE